MMDPMKRSRLNNMGLAMLVFLLMCVLPTVASYAVSFGVAFVAAFLGGRGATVGAINFLMDNLNVYSIMCYVAFGAPILAWLYVMIQNAKRARRMLQAAQISPQNAQLQQPQMFSAQRGVWVQSPAMVPGQVPPAAQPAAQAPWTQPQQSQQAPWVQQPQAQQQAPWAQSQQPPQTPRPPAFASNEELARNRVLCIAPNTSWRGFGSMPMLKSAFLAFAMNHFTTIVMLLIAILLPHIFDEYTQMVSDSGMTDYGIAWFIATIILPPLVEEAGFRGLGMTYLKRAGIPFIWANLIQAVFFGIFHMNIVQGIYAGILGLALGYLAHHYNSLAAPMVMHAVYNFWGTVGTDIENIVFAYVPDLVIIAIGIVLPIFALKLIMDENKPGATASPVQFGAPNNNTFTR